MLLIFLSGGLLTLFAILALLWYIFAGSCCILGFLSGIFIVIKRHLAPYYQRLQNYFFPTLKHRERK